LRHLIRAGRGQGLPVALDFDNTIVCGDIGEATLAVLARGGQLTPQRARGLLSPTFRRLDGQRVAPDSGPDLTAYYEALLAPTVHGGADPAPLANGYVWAAEVMEGLGLLELLRATAQAYAASAPGQSRPIVVTPGETAYPAPFFYPETVELIAALRRYDFDVWIVSASNVWSVRWMVQHALNPLLHEAGAPRGIPPQRVVGVSVLLADRQGHLYKDACLVRQNPGYARLEPPALRPFRLTSRLQFPVPTYSGKVGCLWDALRRPPVLAAGDSPGDHAMLSFSRTRLWIARLEKPDYQAATVDLLRQTGRQGWLVQPVLAKGTPGFLPDPSQVPELSRPLRAKVQRSLQTLGPWLPGHPAGVSA
jgi:hypothetical protein